jgi:hypothetical protein
MITTTAAQAGGPRAAQLDRATAMRLAAEEYDRFLAVLAGLADADWAKPTDGNDRYPDTTPRRGTTDRPGQRTDRRHRCPLSLRPL